MHVPRCVYILRDRRNVIICKIRGIQSYANSRNRTNKWVSLFLDVFLNEIYEILSSSTACEAAVVCFTSTAINGKHCIALVPVKGEESLSHGSVEFVESNY